MPNKGKVTGKKEGNEVVTSYKAYLKKYAPHKYSDEFDEPRIIPRFSHR
ncbi:MAG: hypothetical protein PHU18_05585 [Dehalococcoidales bacterium]|jgi:hypothetical protein|nr:hypothetical protein [Dehalococcoidales bacterium]MDX9799604.1 hypothetical protein [Bacteroidales bacterium]